MNLPGSWPRWLVTLLLVTLLDRRVAWAQADPADLALQRGREGVALYEQGQWQEALALFREADALYHSPVLTLYAARSLRNLGRLLDSSRMYAVLAHETISDDAPPPWKRAQADGAAEARALDAELPRLLVRARPVAPGLRATLDGKPLELGEATRVDPGEHVIEVFDGPRTRREKLTIRPGEKRELAIDMAPPAAPPVSAFRVAGIVSASVGGGALIGGAILGGLALSKSSAAQAALPERCSEDGRCPIDQRAEIERSFEEVYPLAHASDGLFIAGGVAAAAGIVLLIVDPHARSGVTVGSRGTLSVRW